MSIRALAAQDRHGANTNPSEKAAAARARIAPSSNPKRRPPPANASTTFTAVFAARAAAMATSGLAVVLSGLTVIASVSAIYGLGSPEEYRENLLILLERRLDNIAYRLGFAGDHAEARQLVRHDDLD